MTLAYSISVYLRRDSVLTPSELSESSPDQAGSIRPSPLVGPFQSYRPSARLTKGSSALLGYSCSPVSSQIMLSSEKEFTAEKTLFQFDFGLASGFLFFLNGFTECSCTPLALIRTLSRMMCSSDR